MSSAGIFLLVTLALAFAPVHGFWWNMFDWSTEEPANCPHENHETHKCSTLQETNGTCITVKCCHSFEEHEDAKPLYLGSDDCSLCFTMKTCNAYRCRTRCCDGYEQDRHGRCQNKTGHIQCKNGGSLFYGYCRCPIGFVGRSCEIPICNCENGGECEVKDGKPFCECSDTHYGERCEHSQCTIECQNGGTCFRDGIHQVCNCPSNYIGKTCETHFEQPTSCPIPDIRHLYCGMSCMGNDDCMGGKICCKEGCSTVCREPKVNFCKYEGREFRIGQTHQPDVCTNCTCERTGKMMCYAKSCHEEMCEDGSYPVRTGDKCCPTCPDKPSTDGPIIKGCPSELVHVNTSLYNDVAVLSVRDVPGMYAYVNKYSGTQTLRVQFSPSYVRHCHCGIRDRQRFETTVQAFAEDRYGNKATCSFKVVVHDKQQPMFKSCPEDIYVFNDEVVQWKKPVTYDNVGIMKMSCTDKQNGQVFPVGQHGVSYAIWDYDGNSALCKFHVSVSRRDTDMDEIPQGLRDRSRDKEVNRLMIILGPILGAVLLILLAIAVFLCCRCRKAARASTNAPGRQTPAFDNNIYSIPGDVGVKLPPYSDLPMNPPAYSITGTEKDVTYMSLAPPSYTNPGYETVKVHQKTEPVKSEKSDTEEK